MDEYVNSIRNAMWGGDFEWQLAASKYNVTFRIYSADHKCIACYGDGKAEVVKVGLAYKHFVLLQTSYGSKFSDQGSTTSARAGARGEGIRLRSRSPLRLRSVSMRRRRRTPTPERRRARHPQNVPDASLPRDPVCEEEEPSPRHSASAVPYEQPAAATHEETALAPDPDLDGEPVGSLSRHPYDPHMGCRWQTGLSPGFRCGKMGCWLCMGMLGPELARRPLQPGAVDECVALRGPETAVQVPIRTTDSFSSTGASQDDWDEDSTGNADSSKCT